ncbi:MAG TPA: hypothetical protein VNJ07_07010 [Chitinophagales bacterium]|nr:hypothetical protein [Chitinophagales bacterium]
MIILIPLSFSISAQDILPLKRTYFAVPFPVLEIKDRPNYGMEFKGLEIPLFRAGIQREYNHSFFDWHTQTGGGILFREGMQSLNFQWKLNDVFYGIEMDKNEKFKIYFGPSLILNYTYQLYPFLHAGHSFWFTNYSIGPKVFAEIPLKKIKPLLKLSLYNSIAGVTSRPDAERDPYFYSFKFTDLMKFWHHDMRAGTFNLFNYTCFTTELYFTRTNRDVSLAYNFNYIGYYREPRMDYLSQGVIVTVYFVKK